MVLIQLIDDPNWSLHRHSITFRFTLYAVGFNDTMAIFTSKVSAAKINTGAWLLRNSLIERAHAISKPAYALRTEHLLVADEKRR